ncbi:serine/threonine-protein kinase [Nonomuraea sp. B19D2]|uniref:serine/threonine-protein kinase n=1 Tax=Nonomuraea sp. B19D2 TaxID=3159561 RepID=UPI0032DBC036
MPLRPPDPSSLGRYRLRGVLGEGGQGVVYLGETPQGRPVAIKVLHVEFNDHVTRARFVREFEVARRVAAFSIATVIDADVEADRPYIVSEYVPGPSLQQAVSERGPFSGAALHRLAVGTAMALASIHATGIVHRDFKPSNILLGPDGPRVIDFGIATNQDLATITATGIVGTPAYMAPESMRGERAGPAADAFAWAGVLLFAATGSPPFDGASVAEVMYKVLQEEPSRLKALPEPLYSIARPCLEKDPIKRPPMREVLLHLTETPAPDLQPSISKPDAGVADPDRTRVHRSNDKRRGWNPLPNWLRRNR